MSSRERKCLARAVLGAVLALTVSACGFQPLYGPTPSGSLSPTEKMAAVRIAPLPDRIGQQMHNLLRDRLNPAGQPRDPAYELRLTINEAKQELGIRRDETASRANLILAATFALVEVDSGQLLFQGQTSSTNSYNILSNQFATTYAESNARSRGLREISDDIRTRLGIYFSSTAKSSS